MNHTPKPEASLNPTPEPRPVRFRFLYRLSRALLCVVVCLVTFVALLHAVENWRGKRAWTAYQQDAEAKGAVLDLQKLVPPPVPDEQNFAMTPFLAPLFDFQPGTQTYRDTNNLERIQKAFNKLPNDPRNAGDWRKGEKLDLSAWLAAFNDQALRSAGKRSDDTHAPPSLDRTQAAAAFLPLLKEYDPILDELRAASRRPQARFNVRYEQPNPAEVLLPHLARLKALARLLSLRASAELALGQTEPALEDLNLAFYLTESVRNEPMLISHLVRCAMVQLALQPLWEGLADRRWSGAQLQALAERLQKFDFLADNRLAMRGERAFGNTIIAHVRQNLRILPQLGNENVSEGDQTAYNLLALVVPRGWFYFEQVNYDRLFEQHLLPGVNPETRRVEPAVINQLGDYLSQSLQAGWRAFAGHRVLSGMLLPAVVQAHRKFAYVQTSVDEARIACALERYRLANGQFPESPTALVPRFLDQLPHDLISGEPLKYRRTENGHFLLYSVGWNQKDDGGETALTGKVKVKEVIDFTEGDWVWH